MFINAFIKVIWMFFMFLKVVIDLFFCGTSDHKSVSSHSCWESETDTQTLTAAVIPNHDALLHER